MAGIMDKLKFIRKTVMHHEISDSTVDLLQKLKNDEEPVPLVKTPVKILAIAALDLLDLEKYSGTDEDVSYWKNHLANL